VLLNAVVLLTWKHQYAFPLLNTDWSWSNKKQWRGFSHLRSQWRNCQRDILHGSKAKGTV